MGIEYIGKCLLITEGKERVLVIGDLHLAHVSRMGIAGVKLIDEVWNGMIEEFNVLFSRIKGCVDYVVLLGDLRSGFGRIENDERNEMVRFFDYLKDKCREIIVIRGNHDNYVMNVLAQKELENKEVWNWKGYLFIHGDKGVDESIMTGISCLVMGHMHPAITLIEAAKKEKYKCFLVGNVGKRTIIIVPSFIDVNEGIDVASLIDSPEYGFDLRKFNVKIVGEDLEVLDFGTLGKLVKRNY